jgi:hypothetical protein
MAEEVIAAPAPRTRVPAWRGVLPPASGMALVGGSVAVSGVVTPDVMFVTGAIRYAAACLLLIAYARLTGRELVRPRGTEWLWLAGIASAGLVLFNIALVDGSRHAENGGLVLFNIALVDGSRHAEPAVLGVAVASVPPVLSVVGPAMQGMRPRRSVVLAAVVVSCGAALVDGLGRSDALGIGYALIVFGCEAAFTLLAVPVLGRLGPVGVSVHTAWMGSLLFTVGWLIREGPLAVTSITGEQWAAVAAGLALGLRRGEGG